MLNFVLIWCQMQNRKMLNAIVVEEEIKLILGRKAMCLTSMNFLLHRNILQNPSNALLLLLLLLPLLRPHNIRSSPSSPCGYSLIHPMFILLDKEGAGNKRPLPFQGPVVFMGMKILFEDFVLQFYFATPCDH